MVFSLSRTKLAAIAMLGAAGCSTAPAEPPPAEPPPAEAPLPGRAMHLHGQRKASAAPPAFAPPGAHLQYLGGRIVSNIQVVQVLYGGGNYLPQIATTASPSIATFYQGVLNSAYVDWLTEYNTVGMPPPFSSDQLLGRGSFAAQVQITPSPANGGATLDDLQIRTELSNQLADGHLPAPTADAAGNNNTYYAIYFPHGTLITQGGASSCTDFCAYHSTMDDAAGLGEIYYGVHPDFQPGSGCEIGCGAAATPFGNVTQVASHELVEVMTDPEIGIAQGFGPPLAWVDPVFSEIGDICNNQHAEVVGGDGVTYDVQTEFSNALNDCIVTNPLATPLIVNPAGETCRGTTAVTSATVFGGPGRFTSDVALSLTAVTPAPPPGGEITASFDPDPVPAPSVDGATAAVRIASTALTPPGAYTLTVQAASAELIRVSTTALVIRSAVPGGPSLIAPANGADVVPRATAFSWSAVDQATQYELDVFAGDDCSGPPVRTFTTGGTSFAIPDGDALDAFAGFSWHVVASNACGGGADTTSACNAFRTASCSETTDLIENGGFETGLASWTVEQSAPPPIADATRPRTGLGAVQLGTVSGFLEPTGDSQISQTIKIPAGSTTRLRFWEWPLTRDSITFDQQYVRVAPIEPLGATVVVMNEVRNDQTYVLREFDLSAFAGLTVKLIFGVHEDGAGDFTGMFIDDITVSSQNCGAPDFGVALAPVEVGEVCAGSSVAYAVSVSSINGPNFTSPVTLSAGSLPPGATAAFADNPVPPGTSTIMTVTTARPTPGSQFAIGVSGSAVTPPPDTPRAASAPLLVDPNAPDPPEIVNPRIGEVNVPRRPTLSWTSPFVPDSLRGALAAAAPALTGARPGTFAWQLAANRPPAVLAAFGAASYHLQIAHDAAFTSLVIDTTVTTTSFTVPIDLDVAAQYFWRVTATNACGTSAASATASFIVGACFEGWNLTAPIPQIAGPSQSTVIASPIDNKLYVFGGGLGAGPSARTDQTWAFDPATGAWARKADIPKPGAGSTFGAGAQVGGTVYLFGGVIGPPGPITTHRAVWRYHIASDSWTRGHDLPTDNLGAAVAAINGQIYLAYGTGFVQQAWRYDPVADSFTRVADAPALPQTVRLHATVLAGEMHAFAGGFAGTSHVIYNPAGNTWRTGPAIPFPVTDPAVGVLAGKAFVVGGRPIARTQIFDPATGSWSQGAPIAGAINGIDNTAGAALGAAFHLIGGFDGSNGSNSHWQLHVCSLGRLSSAAILPFIADGNGKKTGIGNEATALLIDNSVSAIPLSVSCFLYGTTGEQLGAATIQVAPNELRTVTDVFRELTHTTKVQNAIGSLALFGTEVFHTMASVVNNASGDSMFVDGQPAAGATSGWISTVGTTGYLSQAAFANGSPTTSVVQLLAYPAAGGATPVAGSVAFVPAHGLVSYPDVVKQLGLPASFTGQLSWTASQPIAVMSRDTAKAKPNFSGSTPSHGALDASPTAFVAYVEDTTVFSTALELGNPGAVTANATVHFVEAGDPSGGLPGVDHARDVAVAVNSAAPIADIVRWSQTSTATSPSGKRGFLIVSAPQPLTAQARLVDRTSLDPATVDAGLVVTGLSPVLLRIDQLPVFRAEAEAGEPAAAAGATGEATNDAIADAAAATPSSQSRFAVSNPGGSPVAVQIAAFNATGSAAGTITVTVAGKGQFFTENLGAAMGLPPVFLGWIAIQATGPVLIYNHRRTGTAGATVPVHAR